MSTNYNINLDVKFDQLQLIDVDKEVAACTEKWFNQTLCKVNASVVRLGVLEGEFHWHNHPNDDEFFYVLDGQLVIDIEGGEIVLKKNQGTVIPKGVEHRPRAKGKTVVLMIATASIKPKGD